MESEAKVVERRGDSVLCVTSIEARHDGDRSWHLGFISGTGGHPVDAVETGEKQGSETGHPDFLPPSAKVVLLY